MHEKTKTLVARVLAERSDFLAYFLITLTNLFYEIEKKLKRVSMSGHIH